MSAIGRLLRRVIHIGAVRYGCAQNQPHCRPDSPLLRHSTLHSAMLTRTENQPQPHLPICFVSDPEKRPVSVHQPPRPGQLRAISIDLYLLRMPCPGSNSQCDCAIVVS
jgi:hypothetical protein